MTTAPHAAYLAWAAIGPCPAPVLRAAQDAVAEQAALGVGAVGRWLPRLQAARADAAALTGLPNVGFVGSTTAGVHAVADGLDWRAGDRIVLFRGEFPSNVLPWLAAAARYDLEVVWLDADAFADPRGLEQLADALRGGVRLVAVSAVQFQTGLRMPLAEIAALTHAAGGELFVDAIQALGAVPLHDCGADYLAAGGHKWLMAPMGTGLVAWRDGASLRPVVPGWIAAESAMEFLGGDVGRLRYDKAWATGPAVVESAAMPFALLMGLAEALRIARERDPMSLLTAQLPRAQHLADGLRDAGWTLARPDDPARHSLIVAAQHPEKHPGRVVEALARHGVVASSPDGWLRLSVSWPNTDDGLNTALAALREA